MMQMDKRTRGQQTGFTLIELMIVVALIGTLSAIAVPNFLAYQAKTRRSEAFVNLSGMATTYTAFYAEEGYYPDMFTYSSGSKGALPDTGISAQKIDWDSEAQNFFDMVGFQIEGRVWHQYDVTATPSARCTNSCTNCFTMTAYGDTDNDGDVSAVIYSHPERNPSGTITGECTTFLGWPVPVGMYDQPVIGIIDDGGNPIDQF